jgi:hypothetical protein
MLFMIPAFLWFVDRLANSPRGGFVSGSAGRQVVQPDLGGAMAERLRKFQLGAYAFESSRRAEAIFDAADGIDNSIDAGSRKNLALAPRRILFAALHTSALRNKGIERHSARVRNRFGKIS